MDTAELSRRLEVGLSAAREAGRHTLKYFRRSDLVVDRKQDASPVTVADREAEQLLRARFSAAFPDDAILGEEFPEQPGTSGYRWIVDPIDGTKSFIHGVPLYGTLIGLEFETRSVLGIIVLPPLDECLYAAKGQGAWLIVGDRPTVQVHVSQTQTLAESLFCTSESLAASSKRDSNGQRLRSAPIRRAIDPHLGRLLRLLSCRHRPGRRNDRSDDERLGRRRAATDRGRSRRHVHRLAREPRTIHSGEGVATNGLVLEEVLKLLD